MAKETPYQKLNFDSSQISSVSQNQPVFPVCFRVSRRVILAVLAIQTVCVLDIPHGDLAELYPWLIADKLSHVHVSPTLHCHLRNG
jgi:hypothetical protein